MTWKEIETKSRGIPKVTIRNNSVAFSSFFIRKEQLENKKYVEILEDAELRRIGFRFLEYPSHYSALTLRQDGGKKGENTGHGKIVNTDLRRHQWIKEALERTGIKHSFIIQTDTSQNNPIYYIELSHSYSGIQKIEDIEITLKISGVYRLIGERFEILRIGEGEDIRSRLITHLKKSSPSAAVRYFDFFIVDDYRERKKEEQRLFAQYKKDHANLLPPFNSINA